MRRVFAGVDVGTGSVRAGLFDEAGCLLGVGKHPIRMWREAGEVVEQSSDDVWGAVGAAMREALVDGGVRPEEVAGIGFDATCSLVAIGGDGRPVTVSLSGEAQRNVIVWMDHRASAEAEDINATGDDVLRYVGGAMSPEMEMPKLLWLRRHLPAAYDTAAHFFDLTDFLGWRATGSRARSVCTVTCKWGYLPHAGGWSNVFLARIGLGDLAADGYARIGSEVVPAGSPLGHGLTPEAAAELGLVAGTPVAAGLIDAHAGGLGTVGGRTTDGRPGAPEDRIGYIFGTSACIMASTVEPAFVGGVWGPYRSAMVPGLWLNEGGQSAAGAAVDHIVRSHPAYAEAELQAGAEGVLGLLERRIIARVANASEAALLARHRHVLPDFIGNRSPHADPAVRGAVFGIGLDATVDDLEIAYVAGLCGIAYGLADVLDALAAKGVACDTIVASGGASRSPLVRQILADATGQTGGFAPTGEPLFVWLGAAILATIAAGRHGSAEEAMAAMSRDGEATRPTPATIAAFHRAKRGVHHDLQVLERRARASMGAA